VRPIVHNVALRLVELDVPRETGQIREVAVVSYSLGGGDHRVQRDPGQCTADADAYCAGCGDFVHRQVGAGEHVDGLVRRLADQADLLSGSKARRVQHVRTGLLVGLQPGDRVVEIWVAANVVLGAPRDEKREVEKPGGFARGGDAFCRLRDVVDLALGS